MSNKTLSDYKAMIANAMSEGELHEISYSAFLADKESMNIIPRPKTLSDKIDMFCVKREFELEGIRNGDKNRQGNG